jgi:Poly(ADP-ribose) polymerase and DNA-Ligase Zn-finger region
MPHVIERASTGRALCRGCGAKIGRGEQRFGERLPNPYAEDDGEMTRWYHLACAAFKRPEPLLETLAATSDAIDDRAMLEHEARFGITHPRVPRVNTIERATTARAACRSCHEPIEKGAWRISLVYYEDGRFAPSGFLHVRCVQPYFETTEILPRLRRFTPALSDAEAAEIEAELTRA